MKKKDNALSNIEKLNNIGNDLDIDFSTEQVGENKAKKEEKPSIYPDNIRNIIEKSLDDDNESDFDNQDSDNTDFEQDSKYDDSSNKVTKSANDQTTKSKASETSDKITDKKSDKDEKNKNGIKQLLSFDFEDESNEPANETDFPTSNDSGRKNSLIALAVILVALFLLIVLVDQSKLRSGTERQAEDIEAEEETLSENENATEVTTEVVTSSPYKYTDVSKMTNDEIAEAFFANTVFIGDSLTVGFSNYAALSDSPAFLKQITYLAAVNYGTYNALKPVEGNNVHPIYKGEPVAVCDAVKEIQPTRIFVNLGINELAGSNAIQRTIYNYCQLVYNLKLSSPDSKIYVISVSPMTKSQETSTFNNDTIKEFNKNLEKYAEPWGATYVDLASILTNEQGALPESYSTDGYVHLTNTVYSYWGNYFRKYATEHINDGLKK